MARADRESEHPDEPPGKAEPKATDDLFTPALHVGPSWSAYPALPSPFVVPLTVTPAHPCSYLPDRDATTRAFRIRKMTGMQYQAFMDASFRRSGTVIYQPVCAGCRACESIRVPVAEYHPNKSQRRCMRKNADLSMQVSEPCPTEEKYAIYKNYQLKCHADGESTWDSYVEFLYDSPVATLEFCYRDNRGRVLGVGICDVCEKSLSSVYFYYDVAEVRRGLGIYSALREIGFAVEWGIPYYYLGFRVQGCSKMQYKSNFQPAEILHSDGQWRVLP
jgi:arginine-tRNA-protein transferase